MPVFYLNLESEISLEKSFYLIAIVASDLISWQSDVQLKSKHTVMWIFTLNRVFFLRWKTFLKAREKELYKITGQTFYGKIKLVNY